ncbi:MAG: flagellar basal body P-ring protein FlgI [Pyrinomonadaceae bacterium]|nr:flagellar basal body P-ring protein FlgI [Phycisphaerales bacterium]
MPNPIHLASAPLADGRAHAHACLAGMIVRRGTLIGLVGLAGLSVAACSSPKRELQRSAEPVVVRDIPEPLRRTVGAEVTFRGIEPTLVSGFGIVVGLSGTGGGYIDPGVRATMERELARGGISRGNAKPGDIGQSPDEFLRDPNVTVVIVEAAIPPGAPKGAKFDVRVRTLPNSGTGSLEGGMLWTVPLRIGPATTMTGVKTRVIAEARGPIFINPFAQPGGGGAIGSDASGQDAVNRTSGRILGGGVVTDPLKIDLVLDNESHTRARAITAAINTRFPEGRSDDGPTASGRNAGSVAVRVPMAYRDRADEFLGLLRHLSIDQSFSQELARRYVEDLKTFPELADNIGWCLRAIGPPAVPFLKDAYDFPQLAPRLAALEAGAKLGDPRTLPHLRQIAENGPAGFKVPAIQLMGVLPPNPLVNESLRDLVNSSTLDVRIAAYEALLARRDVTIDRMVIADDPRFPKFFIDLVPSGDPLIYITQQGEPRIVLFGGTGEGYGLRRDSIQLDKPLLVSAWSDRFMLAAESEDAPVRLMYSDPKSGRRVTEQTVPPQIAALLAYMAHKPSPEDPAPGLGFSYSEVVGALYEIHRQQGVMALFATEQDRLLAMVADAAKASLVTQRPEVSTDAEGVGMVFEPEKSPAPAVSAAGETAGAKPTLVVPLERKPKK